MSESESMSLHEESQENQFSNLPKDPSSESDEHMEELSSIEEEAGEEDARMAKSSLLSTKIFLLEGKIKKRGIQPNLMLLKNHLKSKPIQNQIAACHFFYGGFFGARGNASFSQFLGSKASLSASF